MIRSEIIDAMRVDCPEITARVITDAQCYEYLKTGDKEFCAETRCIVDQGTTITTVANEQYWDLTSKITNFFDIDKTSTSGVTYNARALEYTTISELDNESINWRSRDAGTPKKWFRRGKYLWVDRKIDSAADDIVVYASLISDDWNADVMPYSQLEYLKPFHYAMVLYLIKRCKAKIGKPEEAIKAQADYNNFVIWAKKQLGATRFGQIYFRKKV